MLPIEFSADDLRRGELIEPDFYEVNISSVEAGQSKDGNSTNYLVKGTIVKNDSNGDLKYAGYPCPYWNFNSKAPGFTQGYFKALGVELKAGQKYDLEYGVGKNIVIFIENNEYAGTMRNGVKHQYRAPRG